jgi:hypothetical protein
MDDSFYSQFGDSPAPEAPQPKVREVNWQANREDNSKPYVNSMPNHVKEAMTITQKDLSYYAFSRLAFGHPVADSFEQSVNQAYKDKIGELEKGFIFIVEREKYIKFYKLMMGDI